MRDTTLEEEKKHFLFLVSREILVGGNKSLGKFKINFLVSSEHFLSQVTLWSRPTQRQVSQHKCYATIAIRRQFYLISITY